MEWSLFSSFMAILFLLLKSFYQFVKWDHLNWNTLNNMTTYFWKSALNSYLDQRYETVDLSIERATMQSCPARLLILYHQVSTLTLQQPLQYGLLSEGSCHVQGVATKLIPHSSCIVAVWIQKWPQLPLRATRQCRYHLVCMLRWAAFGGTARRCQTHPDFHQNLKVNLSPFTITKSFNRPPPTIAN